MPSLTSSAAAGPAASRPRANVPATASPPAPRASRRAILAADMTSPVACSLSKMAAAGAFFPRRALGRCTPVPRLSSAACRQAIDPSGDRGPPAEALLAPGRLRHHLAQRRDRVPDLDVAGIERAEAEAGDVG